MESWLVNGSAILILSLVLGFLGLALLWRVGSWRMSPAASLTFDEGLPVGAEAPEVAGYLGDEDIHLSFLGRVALFVLGLKGCAPCAELLTVAAQHPATRNLRLVYASDGSLEDLDDVDPDTLSRWEVYKLHDDRGTRQLWRAPVSPYFHLISASGRILEKGIANKPDHLDRLLAVAPFHGSLRIENTAPSSQEVR